MVLNVAEIHVLAKTFFVSLQNLHLAVLSVTFGFSKASFVYRLSCDNIDGIVYRFCCKYTRDYKVQFDRSA